MLASGRLALRNLPGEYRRRMTRAAGHAVDVDVEEREENGDADGGAADEIVVIQLRDFDYFAVGRRDRAGPVLVGCGRGGSRKKDTTSRNSAPVMIAAGHQ